MKTMDTKKLVTMLTGSIMVVFIMLAMNNDRKNPIIGKWRSETLFPSVGRVVNTIEFKKERVEMEGVAFNVHYEIHDKKVTVIDEKGAGTLYEMIDGRTMQSNVMGIETVYKKIDNQ